MIAAMNAPRSMRWPLSVHPRPLPAAPPPAAALTSGVMMLSVNALISVLNASATTRPTAMTIRSPCIRKFLKPLSILPSLCCSPAALPRFWYSRFTAIRARSPTPPGAGIGLSGSLTGRPLPSRETAGASRAGCPVPPAVPRPVPRPVLPPVSPAAGPAAGPPASQSRGRSSRQSVARPVEHTIQLGILDAVRRLGPGAYGPQAPLFGWWPADDGRVLVTVMHTLPYSVLLSDLAPATAGMAATRDEVLGELADSLAGRGHPVPGVDGATPDAMAFAQAWQRLSGAQATVHRRSRLYRLGELTPPRPAPPGAPRVAAEADTGLVVRWFEEFTGETGGPGATRAAVAERIGGGRVTLWEAGGEPVSMAGVTPPSAGVVRVAPVYTPPGLRRRGYAGAVTAAVSQAARDAGAADVVLFTDLANPTSNALYQRLGYRPVCDRVVVAFQRPGP